MVPEVEKEPKVQRGKRDPMVLEAGREPKEQRGKMGT